MIGRMYLLFALLGDRLFASYRRFYSNSCYCHINMIKLSLTFSRLELVTFSVLEMTYLFDSSATRSGGRILLMEFKNPVALKGF